MNDNVQLLKDAGYYVHILTYRMLKADYKPRMAMGEVLKACKPVTEMKGVPGDQWSPKGGYTVLSVMKENEVLFETGAVCSARDNYVKRLGITAAAGRALKELELQAR